MATLQTTSPNLVNPEGHDAQSPLPLDAVNAAFETQQAPTTLLELFDDTGYLLNQDVRALWQPDQDPKKDRVQGIPGQRGHR